MCRGPILLRQTRCMYIVWDTTCGLHGHVYVQSKEDLQRTSNMQGTPHARKVAKGISVLHDVCMCIGVVGHCEGRMHRKKASSHGFSRWFLT